MGRYELSVAEKKQALFAGISGDVLEISPGTGCESGLSPGRHSMDWRQNPTRSCTPI